MKTVRIGASQGFWGDTPLPVLDVVERGNVQYLCGDALAELTLAILQKARQRDPGAGFVSDLIPLINTVLPICLDKGIKFLTNAGGINPQGAADQVVELLKAKGYTGVKVAVVTGDDFLTRLPELTARGFTFNSLDNGRPLQEVADRILFANVYLGAEPLVEALQQGADIVISGRTADPSQFLAPLIYEFGWALDDWDRLAAGTLMGHLMECSAQSTGGNFSGRWQDIPLMEKPGYPVSEMEESGDFIITKAEGTGGLVNLDTVKEQMLYEIHDPEAYTTPDVVADFTTPVLADLGRNRVKVSGTRGRPRPENFKISIGYQDGYLGEGFLRYSWPDALAKARKADEIIRRQFELTGLKAEEILTEFIGVNSLHGPLAPEPTGELNEVGLRIAVRTRDKKEAARVPRYFPPLALNGPPGASGVGGTPKPRELIGHFPSLIARSLVEPEVRVEIREV